MPQARARIPVGERNACCSNGVCNHCPRNAKFTVIGDLAGVLSDTRVTVLLGSIVSQVVTQGNKATGVRVHGEDREIQGDLIVLAGNGIFNPHLLLASGLRDGPVGQGLCEQISLQVTANLEGLEDGDGSALATGLGCGFLVGAFRSSVAGGFFECTNLPVFRADKSRWRQITQMNFLCDDFRQAGNRVEFDVDRPLVPRIIFNGHSEYAVNGAKRILELLPELLQILPVSDYDVRFGGGNHSHLIGTTVMSSKPGEGVIDSDMVHHKCRNLLVLGSGAFPTATSSNPTLTICALSLRAAERMFF